MLAYCSPWFLGCEYQPLAQRPHPLRGLDQRSIGATSERFGGQWKPSMGVLALSILEEERNVVFEV